VDVRIKADEHNDMPTSYDLCNYLSKRVADTIDTSKQQQKRRATKNNTGWWFGTMEFYVSIQVGMSSSFSEG